MLTCDYRLSSRLLFLHTGEYHLSKDYFVLVFLLIQGKNKACILVCLRNFCFPGEIMLQ